MWLNYRAEAVFGVVLVIIVGASTYLSQFINDTYGCSFYQFVNRYRIEEAQRLMRECPEMKLDDVATRSGFSSRSYFTQVFTKEVGFSPREWGKGNVSC